MNKPPFRRHVLTLAVALLLSLPAVSAPSPAPSASPTVARPSPSASPAVAPRSTGPSPAAAAPPPPLGVEEAVRLALERNVNMLLATERLNEARGLETQSRAALQPHLSLGVMQSNMTQNLAALGFTGGLLPIGPVIGPYNLFEARFHLVQNVLDEASVLRVRAARVGIDMSRLEERLARQQVIAAAGLAFVNAQRARYAEAAVQSTVDLAQSLLKLARDQRESGLASGLDVTRAETRLTEAMLRLEQSRVATHNAMMNLLHTVGLPLERPVPLPDAPAFHAPTVPSPADATTEALKQRVEVQVALTRLKLAQYEYRIAGAENRPTVGLFADFGMTGNTPHENDYPTHNTGVKIQVPILDGGLTRGREAVATSRIRQVEIRLRDLRVQVEQDVREAIMALQISAEQVETAGQAVRLAERELKMARDRFSAGLGDNIEVIQAQTALATALDARVAAVARYHTSRINMAAATGRLENLEWAK